MTKKKSDHIHKLKRHTYKTGHSVYMCILPDCFFKSEPEFMLGKRVICNRCDEPFLMSQYSLRLAKPHCSNCHNSHRKDGHVSVRTLVTEQPVELSSINPEFSLANLKARLEGEVAQEIKETVTIFRSLFSDDEENKSDLL